MKLLHPNLAQTESLENQQKKMLIHVDPSSTTMLHYCVTLCNKKLCKNWDEHTRSSD